MIDVSHGGSEVAEGFDDLSSLHAFGSSLARCPDLAAAAQVTLEAGRDAARADAAAFLVFDAERRDLAVIGSLGLSDAFLERARRVPMPGRAAARALEERRTILIEDVASIPESRRSDLMRTGAFRGVLAVPLVGRHEVTLGALSLYFVGPARPSPAALSRVELVARFAADAVEIEQGLRQLEQERAAFGQLHDGLAVRIRKAEDRRRALMHLLSDTNEFNKRLSDQRKAMLHILGDYEQDRSRLARQTDRLDNSRRALLNILKDSHQSNLRLADSRKAMIHIMGDLRETTIEIQRREREVRNKQEQLVQAGKLATLGELTTGVAHELNNPLNNIGLFIGNCVDLIELGELDTKRILAELGSAMLQVRKASEIISHLRTFGRVAPVSREPVSINGVVRQALSLMQEQFRLRQIEVDLDLSPAEPLVLGSPIQLEQVLINLLANARDALARCPSRSVRVVSAVGDGTVELRVADSGPGIPKGLEQRIFDPFFTTKEVGAGTGLGLSITYGIIREHEGSIAVSSPPSGGAVFTIQLPLAPRPAARTGS